MVAKLAAVPTWIWMLIIVTATVTATVFVARGAKRGVMLLARRARSIDRPGEDILTIVAASIATGVSAQGMWRFSGDVLGFDGVLQVLLFAFIEVAVITSAVRARRNSRENYSAGIDGMAVWVLTGLSAVLSSLDARSLAEAIFRLAAPLVAAWLWERGMAIERHRRTGLKSINWRWTPEQLLVRLGLAEARGRTVSEVDTRRRRFRVALAAKRLRVLRGVEASDRKLRKAVARLDRRLEELIEHTDFAQNPEQQEALLDETGTLFGSEALAELRAAPVWSRRQHPALPAEPEMPDDVVAEGDEAVNKYRQAGRTKILPFLVPASRTPRSSAVREPVSTIVSTTARPVNGHSHTPPRTNGGPATALLDPPLVREPVNVLPVEDWPLIDGDVLIISDTSRHTETRTGEGPSAAQIGERERAEHRQGGTGGEQANHTETVTGSVSIGGPSADGPAPTSSEPTAALGTAGRADRPVSDAVSTPVPGQAQPIHDDALTTSHTTPPTEPPPASGDGGEQNREQKTQGEGEDGQTENEEEAEEEGGKVDRELNRTAEEWIRGRCRAGRRPTHAAVGTRYGRSAGWGGLRVKAVQRRMREQGYRFEEDGTVHPPARPQTADDAPSGSTES
ncbi:hypothetical protein [Sphaerisporangium album]|uniref:hypothetical protein n=1 Tax=Sphaerisporangium album TaxID=509200 RepID=UPI0015F07CEF|nr:hypothetical protein [Sphaerisporangium album]